MLQSAPLVIISILFVVSILSVLSDKIKVPYPIFLVVSGLVISLIPHVPRVTLDPKMVFIILLPPLLYAAAIRTSWKEFWFRRRAIFLMAIGLVIFTCGLIGFISYIFIPGIPLAVGFLLGSIISPTDPIAAAGILREHNIPRRALVVLEGSAYIKANSTKEHFPK